MRLLKIGRDASCDIVLPSNRVSSLHAEIILKDSGDIILEDKGSRNGTFVMNQPITPGKSVSIRRGDAIRFADVELNWSQVPMPEDNSAYVALYGIGTHFDNDIQISGSTVSRYHATVKVGRDGKVYLFDHSKNGTTVDGKKVMPHNPYRIKKSSAVVCGGVPVDLSRIVKWPTDISSYFKWIGGIAAAILLLVGVGFGVSYLFNGFGSSSNVKTIEDCQNATVLVHGEYFIDVTIKGDPFVNLVSGWPETWTFGLDENGSLALGTLLNNRITGIGYNGTAFFISEYGEMGTNRHVAVPWEYQSPVLTSALQIEMQKLQGPLLDFLLEGYIIPALRERNMDFEEANALIELFKKCTYEVSGHISFMGIALTGTKVNNITDYISCQVIAESKDKNKDVALLRLNDPKTPLTVKHWYDIENARLNEQELRPLQEELTTVGYPEGFGIAFQTANATECLPTVHKVMVSKKPDDNQFQIQTMGMHGQSGSPIIDSKYRLVGILYGGFEQTELTYACNVKHLKTIYDANKIRPLR